MITCKIFLCLVHILGDILQLRYSLYLDIYVLYKGNLELILNNAFYPSSAIETG